MHPLLAFAAVTILRCGADISMTFCRPTDIHAVCCHPALSHAHLAGFICGLSMREGLAAWALAFTILTAARSDL
jgi:hypothetical protein